MPFTKPELIDAVTKLFEDNDRTRIVSMLPETFVLKIPETLPYGGSFQGAGEFDRFFKGIYEDHRFWSSFRTELAVGRVLDAGSYLVAPLRVAARAKSSGATITVENLWLFEVADGNFVRAQLYADTAAGRNVADLRPEPDAAVLGAILLLLPQLGLAANQAQGLAIGDWRAAAWHDLVNDHDVLSPPVGTSKSDGS